MAGAPLGMTGLPSQGQTIGAGLATGFLGAYNQNAEFQRDQQAKMAAAQAMHNMDMEKISAMEAPRMIPQSLVPTWYKSMTGQDMPQGAMGGVPSQGMGTDAFGMLSRLPVAKVQASTRAVAGSKSQPLDALSQRMIINSPAYQEMANRYIDGKNQYDATSNDPATRTAFQQRMLAQYAPTINKLIANPTIDPSDPEAAANSRAIRAGYSGAAQMGFGEQLRYLHALEFVNQSTGGSRMPSPAMIDEIRATTPTYDEAPAQFAAKLHSQNTQIGSKYDGLANLRTFQGDQAGAQRAKQLGQNYYSGFHHVHDVQYDANNYPVTPGLMGGQTTSAPGGWKIEAQ